MDAFDLAQSQANSNTTTYQNDVSTEMDECMSPPPLFEDSDLAPSEKTSVAISLVNHESTEEDEWCSRSLFEDEDLASLSQDQNGTSSSDHQSIVEQGIFSKSLPENKESTDNFKGSHGYPSLSESRNNEKCEHYGSIQQLLEGTNANSVETTTCSINSMSLSQEIDKNEAVCGLTKSQREDVKIISNFLVDMANDDEPFLQSQSHVAPETSNNDDSPSLHELPKPTPLARIEPEPFSIKDTTITFQVVDITYHESTEYVSPFKPNDNIPRSLFKIFGVTDSGHSICVNVHKFSPFLAINLPIGFSDCHRALLIGSLNQEMNRNLGMTCDPVLSVDIRKMWNLIVSECRRPIGILSFKRECFKNTLAQVLNTRVFQIRGTHNNQPFLYSVIMGNKLSTITSFMAYNKIKGCSWLQIQKGRYYTRCSAYAKSSYNVLRNFKSSNCQLEVDVSTDWIKVVEAPKPFGTQFMPSPHIRVLSFDIETFSQPKREPDHNNDPILSIANALFYANDDLQKEPFHKSVFIAYPTCAALTPDVQIFTYKSEKDLIRDWIRHVAVVFDVDYIIGYNCVAFDFNHIYKRAKHLGLIQDLCTLGRLNNRSMEAEDGVLLQLMSFEMTGFRLHGRIVIDLHYYQSKSKWGQPKSNSLKDACIQHGLGETKEDLHHSLIPILFKGSDEDRRRIVNYNIQDVMLPMKIMKLKQIFPEYYQLAGLLPTPLQKVFTSKAEDQIFSFALGIGFMRDTLIPESLPVDGLPYGAEIATESSFVSEKIRYSGKMHAKHFHPATLDPVTPKFYTNPIAFISLNRVNCSLMTSFNMCFGTLVKAETSDDDKARRIEIANGVKLVTQVDPESKSRFFFRKSNVNVGVFKDDGGIFRRGVFSTMMEVLLEEINKTSDPSKECNKVRIQLLDDIINLVYSTFTGERKTDGLPRGIPWIDTTIAALTDFVVLDSTRSLESYYFPNSPEAGQKVKVIHGDETGLLVNFFEDDSTKVRFIGDHEAAELSCRSSYGARLKMRCIFNPVMVMEQSYFVGSNEDNETTNSSKLQDELDFVCGTIRVCFKILQRTGDGDKAMKFAQNQTAKLLDGKMPLKKLVFFAMVDQQNLGHEMKTRTNNELALQVVSKMQRRHVRPCRTSRILIPYVLTNVKNSTEPDHPLHVLHKRVSVDYNAYNEQVLKPMLIKFFFPIFGVQTLQKLTIAGGTRDKTIKLPPLGKFEELKTFLQEKKAFLGEYA